MSLLDPTIEHYVLDKSKWKVDRSIILNSEGKKIGEISRKNLSFKLGINLEEPSGEIVCTINGKLTDGRHVYNVILPDSVVAGSIQVVAKSFKDAISIYNAEGETIFNVHSRPKTWHFDIHHPDDMTKIFAIIKKEKKFRKNFSSSINFKDRYVIDVIDSSMDRLMLLACAIIIISDSSKTL